MERLQKRKTTMLPEQTHATLSDHGGTTDGADADSVARRAADEEQRRPEVHAD